MPLSAKQTNLPEEGDTQERAFSLDAFKGTGISLWQTLKRLGKIWIATPVAGMAQISEIRSISNFLGDKFYNYLGSLSLNELCNQPIMLGTAPSPLVLSALQSGDRLFDGGIRYPETLENLEKNNILKKDTFFAFANLSAKMAQDEAMLALQCQKTESLEERAAIREKMVEASGHFLATATTLTSHLLSPNPALLQSTALTLEVLKTLYPKQFELAQGVAYSYSNMACINRIVRENKQKTVEADAVIAILERKGLYTRELQESAVKVAELYVTKKTIPHEALPRQIQIAIAENRMRIQNGICRTIDRQSRSIIYRMLARAKVLAGSTSRQSLLRNISW